MMKGVLREYDGGKLVTEVFLISLLRGNEFFFLL